jgi:hypothetical protein
MRFRNCHNIFRQRARIRFKRGGNRDLQTGWKGASIQIVQSAKGVAERRQGKKEYAGPFGGALETAAVLRELLRTEGRLD